MLLRQERAWVGGADWREEMARALVQWLLVCARSDRVCADFVFGPSCGNWEDSCILRGQREGAKIVLNCSIAWLFGSCNYIFVLTICFDFRGRHLVEVFVLWIVVWLAATALVRCIAQFDVLEARVLVRWSAEKQLSESCVFERVVCRCPLTFVFFVFVKKWKGAR